MDEPTRRLLEQLRAALNSVSHAQIARVIQDARDEGFAEARAILKNMTVHAVLEHALEQLRPGAPEDAADAQTDEPSIAEQPVPARPEQDNGCGYYVYGIARGNGDEPPGESPEQGVDPAYPVYAHPYRSVRAIVSKVSLAEFGQAELEANLTDIEWVAAKVRAHHAVLDAALAGGPLLPMRFCTIYRTDDRVEHMLAEHHDEFVRALDRLQGANEWGVKVYCDNRLLSERVGAVSGSVERLRAELEQASGGMAYFARKRLEECTAGEMERVGDEWAQSSHDRLSGRAEHAVLCQLQTKEMTGRDEEMILNAAYLVRGEQEEAFRAEVEALAGERSELGFSCELSGPWPPYNFMTIELQERGTDECVDDPDRGFVQSPQGH